MNDTVSILFVCLGNICRSPLAEGVFLHLAQRRGIGHRFRVDSCGTGGWHAGEPPDSRSLEVARRHGVTLARRARQLDPIADARGFDLVIAMDQSNRDNAVKAGIPRGKTRLLMEFHPARPADLDVPDPYYGGSEGFDNAYAMIADACRGLLDHLTGSDETSTGPR